MGRTKVNVFLEDDDEVVTERMKSGSLAIDFGTDVTVYIQPDSRHYARFTEMLLQKETAPSGEAGDGQDETVVTHTKEGVT